MTIQAGGSGAGIYQFDVRNGVGQTFSPPATASKRLEILNDEVSTDIRAVGNIPRGTTSIQLRVTVLSGSTPTLAGFVSNFRAEVRSDVKADEVLINQGDLGNNITDSSPNTLSSFISQVDELPIQPSDYEDVEWPGEPNGIDDDGVERRRTVTIHRNIQNVMTRSGNTYYAKISYKSHFTGSPTDDGRVVVNFTHNVYTDVASPAIATQSFTGQGATATDRVLEVDLPSAATRIIVGFVVPVSQADARLVITDYDLDIVQRVKASDVSVDATGFSGNLATTDDTVQKVAAKVDSIAAGGGTDDQTADEVSIVTANFSNPNNFPGGIRDAIPEGGTAPGLTNSPTDVQDALNNIDYILTRQNNPYIYNQVLDLPLPGGIQEAFTVNASNTSRLSNPIDLPHALQDLGASLTATVRARVSAISAGFTGEFQFRNFDNSGNLAGAGSNVRTVTDGEFDAGDHVEHEVTISTPVPNSFTFRFRRTSAGATTATLDHILVTVTESASGAGGQTNTEPEIIWEAGASTSARTTATSTTTNYTLSGNRRFDQYTKIGIWFDSDAAAGSGLFSVVPEPAVRSMIDNHGTGGREGLVILEAFNTYKLIKPVTQTTFRIYEGSSNVGIRKIYGIP